MTGGFACTKAEFVARCRNAEDRRLEWDGFALTETDFGELKTCTDWGGADPERRVYPADVIANYCGCRCAAEWHLAAPTPVEPRLGQRLGLHHHGHPGARQQPRGGPSQLGAGGCISACL